MNSIRGLSLIELVVLLCIVGLLILPIMTFIERYKVAVICETFPDIIHHSDCSIIATEIVSKSVEFFDLSEADRRLVVQKYKQEYNDRPDKQSSPPSKKTIAESEAENALICSNMTYCGR